MAQPSDTADDTIDEQDPEGVPEAAKAVMKENIDAYVGDTASDEELLET